jgi:peptidoglycan/LPS O-acetylase OafA/YrhL
MTNKPRAHEIDLLRFLAAVAVVLYHYAFLGYLGSASSMPYLELESIAKYGHFGVELFFLISGFVILMSASSGLLKQFILSRVARLYPAFWFCCTFTFLVILLLGGEGHQATLGQYLSNMTMLSSFGFMQKIVAAPYIDGSYWSLAVELRFYAFVALVLLFRQIRRAELLLAGWLLVSIAVELLNFTRLRGFLIVDYAAYFIGGAMLFQVWSRGFSILRVTTILLTWIFALYQAALALPHYEENFHTQMSLPVVLTLLSSFFVLMGLIAAKKTGWFGRRNWMLVGALTYPLYLLHQVVGYILISYFYPGHNRHIVLWGTLGLMLVLAYLVNIHIEQRYSNALKKCLENGWNSIQRLVLAWRARLAN